MKKHIKTTDWLTRDMTEEQIQKAKEEAIKEADIELIANEIFEHFNCHVREEEAKQIANHIVNAGYRKQKEGIWTLHANGSGTCSKCHFTQRGVWDYDNHQQYCGVCGARMIDAKKGKW